MSTVYERFTNDGFVGEGGLHEVPPSYKDATEKSAPFSRPAQHPLPQQRQMDPSLPQQPGTYSYEQRRTQHPMEQTIMHTVTNNPVPRDYFGLAIFTLICTTLFSGLICWPIGICALMKSNQVNDRIAAGDFEGAVKSGEAVKRLAVIGLTLACVCTGVTVVAVIMILSNPDQFH